MEIWKKIKKIKNHEISNYGRIKRLEHTIMYSRVGKKYYKTYGEKIRKLSKDNNGYVKFIYQYKGYNVHRLVAEAFIDDYNEDLEVDHINNIRHDNRVENLRMVTRKQQFEKESTKLNMIKGHNGQNNKKVFVYKSGIFYKEYESQKSCAKDFCISLSHLSSLIKGYYTNYYINVKGEEIIYKNKTKPLLDYEFLTKRREE